MYLIYVFFLGLWYFYRSVNATTEEHQSNISFILNFIPEEQIESEFKLNTQESNFPLLVPLDELTEETRSLPKKLESVPQYILDNCPLVHLYSEEKYWPADIKEFVSHFHIEDSNGVEVNTSHPLSLHDLRPSYNVSLTNGSLANVSSDKLYMTSNENFEDNTEWLLGFQPEYGTGKIKRAPAVLFIVDKGNGWVDAYWFYFYPFNGGPFIMGYGPWGNHVGDWEHSLVRFYIGQPKFLWMSAHGGGSAYHFDAIEKVKKLRHVNGKIQNSIVWRPLIFSALGTHANYATVGQHSHDVPFFFMPLSDFTDRGPMWDPVLNFYAYQYDGQNIYPMTDREREIGTEWLQYAGTWGDKRLKWADPRQKWCPVQWRYIDGPKGPLFKNLERISLCQTFKWWNFWKGCPARQWLKRGEGLDAERNDSFGDNCGILLYKIRPKWLRSIVRIFMWRGVICFLMDYFTG